ncbi:transcription factor S-II, central domain-containing protein [Aspergillus ambiguus]|uniref:putative PHD finger domain protein n=1 Tax=Aspergillus ambiguus TaxID=176160 RepID=UPI003CCDE8AE
MADEPRRSGRSTKGQHKNLDLVPETPAKKSKAKSQSKDKHAKTSAEPTPAPSEEEEIIRCICGEYEEEEDVERDMICCDQCSAWQHNDCMGLKFAKGEEPDQYFCEQCRPENHKELLNKMARGEKPWEEAAERRRQEAEEKKSRRKKGKRGGRKGRPSEPRTEASTPGRTAASTTPAPVPPSQSEATAATPVSEKHDDAADAQSTSTQKRKFEEHQDVPTPEPGPKAKQQKTSPVRESTTDAQSVPVKEEVTDQASQPGFVMEQAATGGVTSIDEISNPARRSAATALSKLFVEQITEAQKRGSFNLPEGKTKEGFGQQLALAIEYAMYQNIGGRSGEPTEAYKLQLRTILFNVKKNSSLRDRLLVGSLSPDALSKMSSQDMASEELQQKDAEIKREAERQHIIVQDQGPRIRRTHKGEEFIEDDNQNVSSEPVFSNAPARRSLAEAEASPSGSPGAQQRAEADGTRRSSKSQAADTKSSPHDEHFPVRGHSPGGTSHDQVFPEVATHIREPVPTGRVQADAEIDQLLKDDEPESPPYSPKDYSDEGIIWHGKVVMNSIADFSSSAKHVGGADLSGRIPWERLAPSTLLVDGRIDIQLASNYLCGLRFSSSTDVSVISISRPDFPKEQAAFDNLFNYFQDRNRYGVVGKHPLPAVKDTYIVPIEAGSSKKPEFIELLENNSLEEPTPARILLVVFVVKTSDSNPSSVQPPSHQPSQEPGASATASPMTAGAATPQQAQVMTPGPRATSQVTPTPSSLSGTPLGHAPYSQPPAQPVPTGQQYVSYPPASSQQAPLTGIAAAVQVLGQQVNSPAIQQLMQRAPNADASQLAVIRDILFRRPETASNYDILMQELTQATTNGHGPQQ